ncbi:molecular chaperone [Morganella morganii]|uniref:fimbrial biogenesis chaperone n=1 Tax=Morganella morganii TaxID=582 RepID=UPI00042890C6|nr:fimbria/pilus periplasmic chaperone [Morganella morganii]HCR3332146.1 fimbria/pilus periplasmic chaperone [Morganella morganii]HCR4010277.1 fimbria/pilus periplasmic chaperone [Morganella morganii]
MKNLKLIMSVLLLVSTYTYASISVDRTRVIYDEGSKGVSVVVENTDNKDPFLVQSWVEDEKGKKITDPLVALPLLQRIEPNQKKQIRISTSKINQAIAGNEESLFYFNVLGIPPKSQSENAVEIVIQSRFKLFYRPKGIVKYAGNNWQKELKVEKIGSTLKLVNPTDYHIIVININDSKSKVANFEEVIIKPNSNMNYFLSDKQKNSSKIVITYVDDYGSPKLLNYSCSSASCVLDREKE